MAMDGFGAAESLYQQDPEVWGQERSHVEDVSNGMKNSFLKCVTGGNMKICIKISVGPGVLQIIAIRRIGWFPYGRHFVVEDVLCDLL